MAILKYIFLFFLNASLFLSASALAGDARLVVAHFMVGNTYPYTLSDWTQDIKLAASKGIDGFTLNVGVDSWQPARVADAYTAALNSGTGFKLYMSFDMTSLPCASYNDGNLLRSYINTYAKHPNTLRYRNAILINTFSGSSCTFGQGSVSAGWASVVKTNMPATYFIPSFFVDPSTFPSISAMDGDLNWNSGWPMGNYSINMDSDNQHLQYLSGKSYMAAVSPWFFTHYGPNSWNKNWIYRSDDYLLAARWELMVQNRNKIDIVQIISWNDYGESHYIGPIHGAQPNSQAWVNGFDHQSWLDLILYYATAYKTGTYPSLKKDRIFIWGRLYPLAASSPDPVPIPNNYNWASDNIYAVVQLTNPSLVTISCGTSVVSMNFPAGNNKITLPMSPWKLATLPSFSSCSVNAKVQRSGVTVINFTPSGFTWTKTPPSYNFNAFVAAS